MRYSEEQKRIIDISTGTANCIVDAVAGSGKTTTLLGIAEAQPEVRIIAVLYNRSLKDETRVRVVKQNLINLEVQTYHGLARKYYSSTVQNDTGIIDVLKYNLAPLKPLPRWKRLVVDEVQDMNPLYFYLIAKLIHDLNNPDLRITVMGDRFQSIYNYIGADPRFLTLADQVYQTKGVQGAWVNTSLSTTYRCSPNICSFINEGLLGYERMIPHNPETQSPPVHYIYGSPFDAKDILIQYIKTLLSTGHTYNDFFVLATSVKVKGRDTPVRLLENALVANNIPVYVPNEEEKGSSNAEENPTNDKIVITTFHQSKGLERKVVILYNFDSSYYDNKEFDRDYLASPLYVAVTRAQKHLFVVHDSKHAPLKFFNQHLNSVVYISTNGHLLSSLPTKTIADKEAETARLRVFNASELTDYLAANAIVEARKYIFVTTVKKPHLTLKFQSTVNTSCGSYEKVSDINGIAIPAYYEWQTRKHMRILSLEQTHAFTKRYDELAQKLEKTNRLELSEILEASNIFSSVSSGYHYKVAQIKSYDWLKEEDIQPCITLLTENIVADDVQYERCLDEQIINNASIRGQIDAYSEKQSTLWELKCVESLDYTHEIQLAIYAWLFGRMYPKRFSEIHFHLLNIKTGELLAIRSTMEKLTNMVAFLVGEKMRTIQKYTDEEFIQKFSKKFETKDVHPICLKMQTTQNTVEHVPLFIDDMLPVKNHVETIMEQLQQTQQTQQLVNTRGRVIVFDLETNGLPQTPSFGKYFPPTELEYYNSSRIVQWSWSLHEADGTLIVEEDHIIKPNPKEYRIMNQQFHNISESMARVQGKEFDTVLEIWNRHLAQATTVVGHNVGFDKHVLLSELYRRNHSDSADEMLKRTWECTMERGKELVGLKARNKLKPPKLRELMHALGINEEAGRSFHNSKHDVYYTAKCYFNEQKVLNSCPKMYEGKHAGKTYEMILLNDRDYAVQTNAVCNVRKLYNSPLRPFSNWIKLRAKTDPVLKAEIDRKELEIRQMEP
jgi:DNA polymerase III epsilon subunit-like protein